MLTVLRHSLIVIHQCYYLLCQPISPEAYVAKLGPISMTEKPYTHIDIHEKHAQWTEWTALSRLGDHSATAPKHSSYTHFLLNYKTKQNKTGSRSTHKLFDVHNKRKWTERTALSRTAGLQLTLIETALTLFFTDFQF